MSQSLRVVRLSKIGGARSQLWLYIRAARTADVPRYSLTAPREIGAGRLAIASVVAIPDVLLTLRIIGLL